MYIIVNLVFVASRPRSTERSYFALPTTMRTHLYGLAELVAECVEGFDALIQPECLVILAVECGQLQTQVLHLLQIQAQLVHLLARKLDTCHQRTQLYVTHLRGYYNGRNSWCMYSLCK